MTTDKVKFTCLIVGTGFAGLAMAIKLKELGIEDFILLEKAGDIGGTWRENTYPGAECDIPSALYSYSFEPYPDWEYKWSMQGQILSYIKYVAEKYDLYHHIHFNQEMTGARWQADHNTWVIQTADGSQYESQHLITAIGQLHHPSIPDFEGKEAYEGVSFHSANWDHEVSLEGKTVGVIGNAASAVQFIPAIAKTAGAVKIFQRSANWMLPKQDRMYKKWEKNLVRRFPLLLKLYRLRIWLLGGALFMLMENKNNWLRNLYQKKSIRFIKEHLKDPDIIALLTPRFPMGAKRILFSDTYYPALTRPHVSIIPDNIERIVASGVEVEGQKVHSVDILIYATGFVTNPFLMGLDIVGASGRTIREAWSEGHQHYKGISIAHFPNFFMMYGPNTNLGHNSIILMIEAQASYIARCIHHVLENKLNAIDVQETQMIAYTQSVQKRLRGMIWANIDDSWYKSEKGDLPNNYPGRTMEYMRETRGIDWSAYNLV